MKVFKEAADRLGAMLSTHGFKYRKSKREARRQGSLFDHLITFGTSRSTNSLPGHVALEVEALAWSDEFGEHRRKRGISLPINEACLFGCPIENIFKPAPPYIRYDIGDPTQRETILSSIEAVICDQVLRAFELVEAPSRLADYLAEHPVPCLDAFNARYDYFNFTSRTDDA